MKRNRRTKRTQQEREWHQTFDAMYHEAMKDYTEICEIVHRQNRCPIGFWEIGKALQDLSKSRQLIADFERTLPEFLKERLKKKYSHPDDDPSEVNYWLTEFKRFTAAGGTTAEEWDAWVRSDDPHKADPVPARGHLRLVSSQMMTG